MEEIPISTLAVEYCYVDAKALVVVLEVAEGRQIVALTKDDLIKMLNTLEGK